MRIGWDVGVRGSAVLYSAPVSPAPQQGPSLPWRPEASLLYAWASLPCPPGGPAGMDTANPLQGGMKEYIQVQLARGSLPVFSLCSLCACCLSLLTVLPPAPPPPLSLYVGAAPPRDHPGNATQCPHPERRGGDRHRAAWGGAGRLYSHTAGLRGACTDKHPGRTVGKRGCGGGGRGVLGGRLAAGGGIVALVCVHKCFAVASHST